MSAAADAATHSDEQNPLRVVSVLGVTQILAWGSTYYLPAVFAQPIAQETGWSLSLVVGGLSLGLLAAGLVSPRVGSTIDRFGGRWVLASSSLLIGCGQMLLALSSSEAMYFLAWLAMGAGMGAGLYDAAFSTLGRLYGAKARRAITMLTLWGGFASTVCWPLSAFLVEWLGWRGACLVYAGLHLGVSLPLHALFVPAIPLRASEPSAAPQRADRAADRTRTILLLGIVLVIGTMISSVVSVHLLAILQAQGASLAVAVAMGALIGPSQVGSRIVEMLLGGRFHPVWTFVVSGTGIFAGLALLLAGFTLPGAAIVLYGAGNGLWTIARGTVPLALFGPDGYATLMGKLAFPAIAASALSPSLGAVLLELGGHQLALASLVAAAGLNLALILILTRSARR